MINEIKAKIIEAIGTGKEQAESPKAVDCIRIKKILQEKIGVTLTLSEVETLWEEISDERCAFWLGVSESDEKILNEYIIPFCRGDV